ncbi:nitrogen regulatory IIA protein [Chitinophaga caeni]|uniref:Nitrogen regulatory IIA protein n=1 Tax=Chitinophaga caeni TaxID=2029983 RepID=A0A291QYC1_9BACT|nr:nitrogen regulatory IIA protein [Chitinophaga caeni]
MEKIRSLIDHWLGKLDQRWRGLPLRRQHRYTLLLFTGYLALMVLAIANAWYDTDQISSVNHIENPVIGKRPSGASAQDSLLLQLKNQIYERK